MKSNSWPDTSQESSLLSPDRKSRLSSTAPFEIITAEELAKRWRVPASWIIKHSRRNCADRIPSVEMGRYRRFVWNSLELAEWFQRRFSNGDGR